jgi:hypothetical protein
MQMAATVCVEICITPAVAAAKLPGSFLTRRPTISDQSRLPPPIERHIYVIRGQKVMLDADLAVSYGVTTSRLNEAIKRNAERFPDTFMFRLTAKEDNIMRSQFVISSKRKYRYQPLAFTEHGVVRAFVRSQQPSRDSDEHRRCRGVRPPA